MLITTTMPDLGGNFLTLTRCSNNNNNSQPVADVITPAKPSEQALIRDDVIPSDEQQQSEPPVVTCDDVTQQSEQPQVVVDVVVRNEGEGVCESSETRRFVVVENGRVRTKTLDDYLKEWPRGSTWRAEKEALGVEETRRGAKEALGVEETKRGEKAASLGVEETRRGEKEALGVFEEMTRGGKEALGVEEMRRGEKEALGVEEMRRGENEALGVEETRRGEKEVLCPKLFLPFLVGAPKLEVLEETRRGEKEALGVEETRRREKEALDVEETRRGEKEALGVEETRRGDKEALRVEETRRGDKEAVRVEETKLFLPFLVGAPKLAECFVCESVIYPGEEVPCAVRDCKGSYHLRCARDKLGYSPSSKAFKCPQHVCFVCNKKYYLWRCSRCHLASHEKCFAYPEYVQPSNDIPWQMVCWRHDNNWPPLKPADPTNSIEEVFCRLPLPYVAEEFKIDLTLRDTVENKPEPPSYLHIRRNTYLVKKKRDDTDMTTGCNDCSSSNCSEDCLCRSQSISCSKACRCSERCTNKPFRKEKKIKIVSTELCGWGVEAAESIKKGEFIIEYVGEVISDALCEQRLWDMKNKGIKNFYMCEIRKDFTIDATFKGNASRFLNHSCGPNCNLEKWHVDGETRVGVFAARSIEAGEPLTYDYRFVQFGPEVKCHCGASTCQGYLGTKKKIPKFELPELLNWGDKRRRTPTATLRMIRS